MNILVIGGGGREHAIIKKLKEDPRAERIFALPGNGGIAADAECAGVSATDIPGILAFARANAVDFAVVAPDDPLVLGAVDVLEEAGIPCFGPRKNAAIIEGSKVFSKNLMEKYHIPTAACRIFGAPGEALAYVDECPLPAVVKADGLALGKGVLICETREEAREAVRLHAAWLAHYWPAGAVTAQAHVGMAEMYVQDERFTAYYDRERPGCARFLRDAVAHWVK